SLQAADPVLAPAPGVPGARFAVRPHSREREARMHVVSLLLVAALPAAGTPSAARADRMPERARTYMAEYRERTLDKAHALIPAWARRYNKNCDACHYPDELGEKVEVEKIQNYIAFRGRVRYDYAKTQNQPASTSEFAFEDATVFYGGPFEKRYGAFFELEREAENAVELTAHIATAWGKENAYGGFRI